jgi:hypothetical protein
MSLHRHNLHASANQPSNLLLHDGYLYMHHIRVSTLVRGCVWHHLQGQVTQQLAHSLQACGNFASQDPAAAIVKRPAPHSGYTWVTRPAITPLFHSPWQLQGPSYSCKNWRLQILARYRPALAPLRSAGPPALAQCRRTAGFKDMHRPPTAATPHTEPVKQLRWSGLAAAACLRCAMM